MANLRFIICTTKAPNLSGHRHITEVGIGSETAHYSNRMTVTAVRAAIRSGDRFYTVSPSTGKAALVEPYDCPACRTATIRSVGDSVTDNNLDNISTCQ